VSITYSSAVVAVLVVLARNLAVVVLVDSVQQLT
jgi:hypothetical protein